MIKYKSHAKNCFKRRLCSCYRFWDIVVANIKNFKIFHFDENLLEQNRKSRRTSSYGLVIGIRIIRIRTRYTSVKQYVKPYEKKTTEQSSRTVTWQSAKKSLNGYATVAGGHATVGRLSNNVFWTFRTIWNYFQKSHWTVSRQWSEATRPSADCQTTFLDVSNDLKLFSKKSLNGHATVVGGHATVTRLSNNVFWTFQAIRENL